MRVQGGKLLTKLGVVAAALGTLVDVQLEGVFLLAEALVVLETVTIRVVLDGVLEAVGGA